MSAAISLGQPLLVEEVNEALDPAIESILSKSIYESEGRSLIRFADKEIDYDSQFTLYLATKQPNPAYLPDVFIKVNVINFSAIFESLEDQLLSRVVQQERPEVEEQRDQNVQNLAAY